MDVRKVKSIITRNLLNILGWRTNRRIVIIESDDWGSIRMADQKAYQYFLKKGYPVYESPYNRYDALESNEDLEMLYEVLSSVKDVHGNPAVMTANCVVANPDFQKIKSQNYQKYFYEPFTETLKQYPKHDRVYDLYKEGIKNKLFWPQFHGREHLNVTNWMNALQKGDQFALEAFKKNMFSLQTGSCEIENEMQYLDALNYTLPSELNILKQIVADGISLFNNIWGFIPSSFIAPCYIWSDDVEATLQQHGIKYIQGMVVQNVPRDGSGANFKKNYHYMGQRNSLGQFYLIRNAFFEPSQIQIIDWIGDCLHRISVAFHWKKPATISSHRLNYIGFIDPANRHRNLALFKELLTEIVKRWPDVEFMTSSQLGDLMNCVKSNETIC